MERRSRARAFFWYCNVPVSPGDADATECALRLKEASRSRTPGWKTPSLVYPGLWRITRDDLDGKITTAIY